MKNVKGRKMVMGAIGLATAAACCVGVGAATGVGNNGYRIVKVYANDAYVEQWSAAIEKLGSIDTNFANRKDYLDYINAYLTATDAYAVISATVSAEDYLIYQQADLLISGDAECYTYFQSLAECYTAKSIAWSHKEAYDSNMQYLNALDQLKKEAIIAVYDEAFEEMVDFADNEFERIKSAMDSVVDAINNIYYNASGEIVVDSEESLIKVADAIKSIYGIEYNEIAPAEVEAIKSYVHNLDEYEQAVIDYQLIVDEADAIVGRIEDAYTAFTTEDGKYYNKYYTQRSVIETLRSDYDALYRATDDDARKLVENGAKIEELEAALKVVDDDKENVIKLIAKIPADFEYKDGYIALTNEAKVEFDKLPEDLKEIAETEITDYDKLEKALKDIQDCVDEVAALIKRAENLQALYDNASKDFSVEVRTVANARASLVWEKQKDEFNEDCKDLMIDMQAKLTNLNGEIKAFTDAVKAIGEVKLSNNNIGTQIDNAYVEYNKLTTDLQRNAVLGYKTQLDEKKAELDVLMDEANDWKVQVEAIILAEKITVQNIIDINNVEAGLNTIKDNNLDMYTVISTSGATYGYATYEQLKSARDGLLEDIEKLASDMSNLSLDLDAIVANPSAFNDAVVAVIDALDLLDDSIKVAYFTDATAANKTAYDRYLNALNIYNEIAKLAGDIATLYNLDQVNMTRYEDIVAYNTEYQALSDENKEILNTQKINDDKTFEQVLSAATEKVNTLKADRDDWTEKVYALAGGIEKDKWADDLYNVDLDAIETLKTIRTSLDNTDNGLQIVDEDFELIEEIGKNRVVELNQKIDELDAKSELEKTDVAILEAIYDIYNNKLNQTQKESVDYDVFEVLYNKYVFAQNFDEAVLALYEDVFTNKNFTSEIPVTVGILRSIYINFGSEMKSLIQEYGKIELIENEYNAHVEDDGIVLNLNSVYNQLLSKIDADGANLSNEISELSDKIVALESAYKNADKELKLALEAAYKADDAVLASAIEELQNKLNTLKANLEKADADIIADIGKVREELAEVEDGLEKLVSDTKAELLAEIKTLENALTQAKADLAKADADNKAELQGKIDALIKELGTVKANLEKADADIAALENALTQAKADLAKADADNKAELQGKIDALIQELATAKANLEKADADIIVDISKVREELAEVEDELEKLISDTKTELLEVINGLRKNLTTVTIILSIVSGLLAVGVIILYVKRKKN